MAGWPWPYLCARLALAAVFIYAGTAKLLDLAAFARVISQYNLAPEWALAPLAVGLPILEVVAGLGLLFDARGSLGLTTALLALFAVVLWFGVLQGLSVDCGCFSPAEQAEHDGLRQALLRDLIMLATAGYMYLWRKKRRPSQDKRSWRWRFNPMQAKEKLS
jgi:uncharacterized membrane protein YphA (DoxX/SURF4 family)